MELRLGKERAVEEMRVEHVATIAVLDEKRAEKAKSLANNPVALSKFLVKAGRTK